MRCIAGIETPDEGRIVVNDRVFFDSERKINLTPQQRKTALLFQSYMLFPNLTVAENVAAGIGREASKADRDALAAAEPSVSGWKGSTGAIRLSCRAASSSAWRWAACWRRVRASSCWTSRSRLSTRT